MNEKTSKILKSAFWAVLALVLLWFSFRGVDWNEFWKVIRTSRWGYVALAMAAGVFSFIFRSLRWRLLMLPVEPATRRMDCYDGFTIGRLCDFAVPHIGNFVRCGYVLSPRMTYDKALGTVVLERVWDVVMLALLIVSLLVLKGGQFGDFFSERVFGPAASRLSDHPWRIALVLLSLALAVYWAVSAIRRSRFSKRIGGFCRGIGEGFSSFLKMKSKGWFLLLTGLLWVMYLLMSWFIIKAIPTDLGLNLVDALFIMLVGSLAGVVPVPGGFGAFHYLVALALQTLYAIPFDTGIIFATLSHESQAITTIACGFLSYARRFLRR
jgi:uncharacterized membrane protein YbhN (UPF0104 family)